MIMVLLRYISLEINGVKHSQQNTAQEYNLNLILLLDYCHIMDFLEQQIPENNNTKFLNHKYQL